MCIGLGIICFFLAFPCVTAVSRHVYWFRNNLFLPGEPGRNRLFLNQYTCLLTGVTHGRARKKQIIPKPIHISTYSSYTWKSQEETTSVTHGRARKEQIIPKPIHMSTYSS
jgi:hypothetical protein